MTSARSDDPGLNGGTGDVPDERLGGAGPDQADIPRATPPMTKVKKKGMMM
jgi:hypothetical protein